MVLNRGTLKSQPIKKFTKKSTKISRREDAIADRGFHNPRNEGEQLGGGRRLDIARESYKKRECDVKVRGILSEEKEVEHYDHFGLNFNTTHKLIKRDDIEKKCHGVRVDSHTLDCEFDEVGEAENGRELKAQGWKFLEQSGG
jgi:hypothetical protein